MKAKQQPITNPSVNRFFLSILFSLVAGVAVCAQTAEQPNPTTSADSLQPRIERARALAAAHQLDPAAAELESIRRIATDDVTRNLTSVMLMGIYLEEGSYVRAKSLLEDDFQARGSRNDASLRTYFAIAGQTLNGARLHMARYRTFGINVSDPSLPAEAITDLDQLRALLERLASQAREIASTRKTYDAMALLEDVLGIRVSLARDAEDRDKWEVEYASAREVLASTETQVASLGGTPSLQRSLSNPAVKAPVKKESPVTPIEPQSTAPTSQPDTQAVAPSSSSPTPTQTTPSTSVENTDKGSQEGQPKTLSTGLLNGRATKRVFPNYPQIAKTSGTKGTVKVFVTIDESGKVVQVSSSEGPMVLRQSAELAARGWRFSPTAVDGKAVRLTGYIEFNFTL